MIRTWRTRALIDLSALRQNVKVIRKLAGDARVYAVVKADAYGHGINNIVPAICHSVDGFAVATLEEGIRCRKYAENNAIMVLSEFSEPEQIDIFRQYQLQPVIHREQQARWVGESEGLSSGVWIKIESGMNRLGISPENVTAIINILRRSMKVKKLGLMSHLASADEMDSDQTPRQCERFLEYASGHPGEVSIANSAALIGWPQTRLDIVRPGLMLYGISPSQHQSALELGLRPVMQLESRLIAVKEISAGDAVGYGASWKASKSTKIGVAGFGYADGYPRRISNRGSVIVRDRSAPVIGKVSMDMMTLDLTGCGEVQEGDIAELWGPKLGVEIVAGWADTIPYELLCSVSPRVPRIPIN
ncbi:MAG: alanine racemase [Arenicellales bacterium]